MNRFLISAAVMAAFMVFQSFAQTNVAMNKTVTVSSVQSGNTAANAVDGNSGTRWCASDGTVPQWLKVDLGASYPITSSEVMWEKAAAYKYRVETSPDNTTWTQRIDRTGNTLSQQTFTDPFTATARYVRITATVLPSGTWASIFEFRVYGTVTTTTYQLTVTNGGNGTTTPSGTVTVNSGAATSISATPAAGYQFSSWTVTSGSASIASPSSSSTTVTLSSGNATIRANFALITYSLTMSNDGHGTTTPSGTVTVNSGAATSISATPAAGYQFYGWTVTSGSASIASPSLPSTTVTLSSGNATIQANFVAITYSLTIANDGHGTTAPSGTFTVGYGIATSISATPAAGYQFYGWNVTSGTATIASPSSSSTTVTLSSGNATIQANFVPITYSLTITNDGHGTTVPSGTITVNYGVATPISAMPAAGYQFLNWTVMSGTASIANPSSSSTTVTLSSGNVTIRANFIPITYSLTITNDGHGTTVPSGTVTVSYGAATPISATPTAGYQFLNWTVTSGTATIASPSSINTTVTLTGGNATVQANFTATTYSLTMTNDGHGTTVPSGTVTVYYGVATSISATPAAGYVFGSWSVASGAATIANPTSATTQVTLTSGNATVAAAFVTAPLAVPTSRQVTISGTLTDASGNPLGASSPVVVDATVRLFAAPTGGAELYHETFWAGDGKGVVVYKGLFVVRLGTGTTVNDLRTVTSANQNLYVEITIEGATPDVLLPRTPLTAAAYSLTGPASISAAATATVLHGTGNPNNADITAAIGAYYIDDSTKSTWLRVNTGWRLVD